MALGGLAVGAISVWFPQVWGNGYSVVNSLLHTPWLWTTVLALLALKVLATTATFGSGAVGGVFTPTLFVGAASGWLFGYALQALWPGAVSPQSTYAVIGMGAFLAAATGAPLMAILMIFEMTLSYQVMLPLMLACVLAFFIARGQGAAMYDITVTRIEEEKTRARLRTRRMRDLVQPAETVLSLDAPFDALARMFLQYPVKYVYAVDAANRYQGSVALQDITSQLLDQASLASHKVADFVRTGQLQTVTADMTLDEALRCFLAHQGERLPVIRSQEDPQLLGAVYKTALLQAYHQLNGQAKG
jgi:CIC family chloride channel protein